MTPITQRKLAKEFLPQSQDSLRLIIDTIPTMAWTVRPDGAVDFVNQRWLDYAGLSLEEEIEEPTRVVHPDDLPRVMEKWLGDMSAGELSEDEMRLRRADGEYRWFLVRTVPLRDELGTIVKWFGTSTEIEDRKKAEAALQHSLEELRALAARLQSVREEERTRVAREIHDELGYSLAAIKLEFTALLRDLPVNDGPVGQRSQSILKLVDAAIQSIQRIATDLRPGILDDLGLVDAVEWVAEEFQGRTGMKVQFTLPEDDLAINQERATALFRILQEALTNVAQHANATHVSVRLVEEAGIVTLEIHDDGQGITAEQLSAKDSLGILGMRERSLLLGGAFIVSGVPALGTTVTVRIPAAVRNSQSTTND